MNKNDHIPWSLIQKALKKSLEEKERTAFEEWLSESDTNRALFKKIKLAWNVSGGEKTKYKPDKEAAWDRIVRQAGIQETGLDNFRSMHKGRVLYFMRAAAAILFLPLVIVTLVLFMQMSGPGESPIVSVHTEAGQRSHFVLEDRTKIWLNSDSELHYASDASSDDTRLVLEGEVYIETPKDRTGNLVISTPYKDVRVMGTTFNVRAYPSEEYVETVLVGGTVELLRPDGNGAPETLSVMRPGQRAVYNKQNQDLHISETSTYEHTAWREGVLVFRNATFDDLANRLEMWFDVEIVYDRDQFDDTSYSGTFRNRENIYQVLESISATTPFSYEIRQNRVFVENEGETDSDSNL